MMDNTIEEIRTIINNWFQLDLKPSIEDILPYLVFLLEEYDRLTEKLKHIDFTD